MVEYKIFVETGKYYFATTIDKILITLVGTKGESQKQALDNWGVDFKPGAIDEYHLKAQSDLGHIFMIRLHKERHLPKNDSWLCNFIQVKSENGKTFNFPYYKWIEGYRTVELFEGTAKTRLEDATDLLLEPREAELRERKKIYRWKKYSEGAPHCIDASGTSDLDVNAQYSQTKDTVFKLKALISVAEIALKGLATYKGSWKRLDDIRWVFAWNKTPVSEYVSQHWQEDAFFGYQFLNGLNPIQIRKCTQIPDKFPVTANMVSSSLGKSTSLQEELQNGNIFLVDYNILEGMEGSLIEGIPQFIAAPMCLLHKTPTDDMIPLAIQIGQVPEPNTPIFLPSDSEWDWTLAKIWVRNADFHVHQAVSHLLNTHLFAEVFAIATHRNLPMCHPLFKLLIPHTRFTLHINVLARSDLIGPGGVFDVSIATGQGGIPILIRKYMESLNYTSLCLPRDLRARGVESLPNYYYKDDGLKIWSAIESFVHNIVRFYYENDQSIQNDTELQAWAADIFNYGFQGRASSGFPSSLKTQDGLIEYLTMVIFTCSAQHAAVNSGQFDFYSWMPNGPSTMRNRPPAAKGTATIDSILQTLPQVNTTCSVIATVFVLSNEPSDSRPLGTFPDQHFTEEQPNLYIKAFKNQLEMISKEIKKRNKSILPQYQYLIPEKIENSVSI